MSFLFANSSMPYRASSRPTPERFTPPKGRSGALRLVLLIHTIPTSSSRAICAAARGSCVKTLLDSPKGDSLARATAAYEEGTRYTTAVGPNSSSS